MSPRPVFPHLPGLATSCNLEPYAEPSGTSGLPAVRATRGTLASSTSSVNVSKLGKLEVIWHA